MTSLQQLTESWVNQEPVTAQLWRSYSGNDVLLETYIGRKEPITSRVFGEEQLMQGLTALTLIHQDCIVFPQVITNMGRSDWMLITRDGLPEERFVVVRVDRYTYKTEAIIERRD